LISQSGNYPPRKASRTHDPTNHFEKKLKNSWSKGLKLKTKSQKKPPGGGKGIMYTTAQKRLGDSWRQGYWKADTTKEPAPSKNHQTIGNGNAHGRAHKPPCARGGNPSNRRQNHSQSGGSIWTKGRGGAHKRLVGGGGLLQVRFDDRWETGWCRGRRGGEAGEGRTVLLTTA